MSHHLALLPYIVLYFCERFCSDFCGFKPLIAFAIRLIFVRSFLSLCGKLSILKLKPLLIQNGV